MKSNNRSELIASIRERVKKYFEGVSGEHGFDHTMNVFNNAVHLAKKEGADLDVVMAAALLHDIGRKEETESKGKLNHAEVGAEKARKILVELGCEKDFIDRVCLCVLRHRTRDNNNPESLEEKVIYDADKLDSSGAVGIGRAFMWAGKVGAKVHNVVPDTTPGAEYGPEDTAYREFNVKLKFIQDRMQTDEGRRLAVRRHEFMVKFFDELNHELEGEK